MKSALLALSAILLALSNTFALPAMAEQETTVYVGGTYNMGSGKATGTAGASHTETRGDTTTKVDLSVNTNKDVSGSAAQTKTR